MTNLIVSDYRYFLMTIYDIRFTRLAWKSLNRNILKELKAKRIGFNSGRQSSQFHIYFSLLKSGGIGGDARWRKRFRIRAEGHVRCVRHFESNGQALEHVAMPKPDLVLRLAIEFNALNVFVVRRIV